MHRLFAATIATWLSVAGIASAQNPKIAPTPAPNVNTTQPAPSTEQFPGYNTAMMQLMPVARVAACGYTPFAEARQNMIKFLARQNMTDHQMAILWEDYFISVGIMMGSECKEKANSTLWRETAIANYREFVRMMATKSTN